MVKFSQMTNEERIELLKKKYNARSDYHLSQILGVNRSQVSRWKKNGFQPSIEKIIDYLLK